MTNALFPPVGPASRFELAPASEFVGDLAQSSLLESQRRGLQSLRDSWTGLKARWQPFEQPTIPAREELIRTQILWANAVLNRSPAPRSREIIRAALDCRAFQGMSYYACGPADVGYAVLKLSLDPLLHLEELRVSPRLTIPLGWEGGIASDLQVLVEQFEDLQIRLGFGVAVRLRVRRELMPAELHLPTGPRIVMADGPVQSVTATIRGLRELTAEYALSDSLPNPRAATS